MSGDATVSDEYRQLAEFLPDDFSNPADSVDEVRAKFDAVHGQDPGEGVVVETASSGVWVRPDSDAKQRRPVVFFVHGGGFVTSDADSYAFYGAKVARACDVDVFVAEYRLAPETRFPGQITDLLDGYRGLLASHDASSIVFMGDSCGGGMALSTMLAARDEGLDMPAAFVGLCGWFDMEATGESAVAPIGRDPFLNPEWLRLRARDYVGPNGDPAAPGVSPLYADVTATPPMLLHAGEVDRCRSDSESLAARVDAAGGHVELEVVAGMPHGFHGLSGLVPEADAAFGAVSRFIATYCGTAG